MHIVGSHCADSDTPRRLGSKYGKDYMESVSLDQVMMANHIDAKRVQLMKIDVEVSNTPYNIVNGDFLTLTCSLLSLL